MARPAPRPESPVLALLGPTNTGKTHHAIQRMLQHRSGVIGLPLRLLAREVYERVLARCGAEAVALVTGEEKILPEGARYFVCTVEAMPAERKVDFVAVDEIQLCADPERGHVFTDRLLHARGRIETLFLGSASAGPRIRDLVPDADFVRRQRLSPLTDAGRIRLDRLPPRSTLVAFSAGAVYELAERVRHRRGGAAVVLGALSPRTRNAQVALFQDGEVDLLVATDAIGMGLNLDIDHMAFAGLTKFDGSTRRPLEVEEIGQIAGRAGRYRRPGTFGVTGEAADMSPHILRAIESQRFPPLPAFCWRNRDLVFDSVAELLAALGQPPQHPGLIRPRKATDLRALQLLAARPEICDQVRSAGQVRMLWDACGIPDYPKLSDGHHAAVVGEVFGFLVSDAGTVPADWFAGRLERLAHSEGDIATLSDRLAHARTCQYIANRSEWLEDPEHWRGRAREVEDAISDSLHARLVAQFVDRRGVSLARSHRRGGAADFRLQEDGAVEVEGESLGRFEGLRFLPLESGAGIPSGPERSARAVAVGPALLRRVRYLESCPDAEFGLQEGVGVAWDGAGLASLVPGDDLLRPGFRVLADAALDGEALETVRRRLRRWLDARMRAEFAPLFALREDSDLRGAGRGIAHRLFGGLGVLPKSEVLREVAALEQEERGPLRRHGVRFGYRYIFLPALLKPSPTALRMALWGGAEGHAGFVPPPPGLVSIPADAGAPSGYYPMSGFHQCGERAVRIDMLERLQDMLRGADGRGGFEASPEMLSITGSTVEEFRQLMIGIDYEAEPVLPRGEGEDGEAGGAPTVCRYRFRWKQKRKVRVGRPLPKKRRPLSPFEVLAGRGPSAEG